MMKVINSEVELDDILSTPPSLVVDMMKKLQGDIIILGIAGKMGINLGMMVVKAAKLAGVNKKVIGVSRFSNPQSRKMLEKAGIETIACDLLNKKDVDKLPDAENVIFMAGKKFGTAGSEAVTWAMNTLAPANVAARYSESRIAAFSTGCVYPFVSPATGGSVETDTPMPVGDYAQSALGRERIFSYFSNLNQTPVCIIRLNYSTELRYGVLRDICDKVYKEQPVDLTNAYVNLIWQGDAVAHSLACLEYCSSPANIMNITGPEILSVRDLAENFGLLLDKKVTFTGTESATAFLNNPSQAITKFGAPETSVPEMQKMVAEWVKNDGASLNKPTHFEVKNGEF